jgi:YidC/Oxa1 family membrane protein insertase
MPQPATAGGEDGGNGMSNAMQSMNTVMPIMSAFFCLTLPVGVGIYWIMSAVIRSIQQFAINKRLDKESQEDIIKAAQEKMNKKRARQGLPPQKITNQAHTSTKSFEVEEKSRAAKAAEKAELNKKAMEESTAYYNQNARPGSLASKANMVKAFDERNNSKGGSKKKK